MLILGCLIAIAVIVFLSNAAPSKGAASTTVEASTSDKGAPAADAGTGASGGAGSAAGGGAAAGETASGAGALSAQNYAAASSSNKDTLKSGETLAEGASLTSKNGKYVFTYEYGTATLKSGNFTMWSSSGRPATGGVIKITDDGNLGIFPSQYSVTPSGWASGTAGQGTKPYSLIVRDAGQLIMLDSTPTVVWTAPVTMPPAGVDCVMGDWGGWSACSKNCGGGVQTRNRAVITQPNTGGKACGDLVETKPCNTDPCPDCAFTWAPFGQCVTQSPSTGAGKKQAQLRVSSPSGPGGLTCPDPNSNIADCVNCVFSPWNPSGELSAQTCNQTTGKKTQSRTVTVPASGGGTCTEPTNREQPCGVDCQLNPWGAWSECTNKNNGVGTNTRKTTVKFPPLNGGKACTTASGVLSGTQVCDASGNCTETRPCGDCVQGKTYNYGNCNPETGRKSRTRLGDVQPSNGGTACPPVTDDVACDIDCQVSGWSEWSPCDINKGRKNHTRTITRQPKNNGTACPPLSEDTDCPVDCEVSEWGEWSACDKSCGGGNQSRSKRVTREPRNGGASCPNLTESQSCNPQSCAPNVVGWAHQFGSVGDVGGQTAVWYQKNGTTNGVTLRLIDEASGEAAPLQLTINGSPYAWPDIWVKFGTPYTGKLILQAGPNWNEVGRQDVTNATSAFFRGVQVGTPSVDWKGSCTGHTYLFGAASYSPDKFDADVKTGDMPGWYVSSKSEYCRYGEQEIVGRAIGGATIDSCCPPPPPTCKPAGSVTPKQSDCCSGHSDLKFKNNQFVSVCR